VPRGRIDVLESRWGHMLPSINYLYILLHMRYIYRLITIYMPGYQVGAAAAQNPLPNASGLM